MKQFILFFALLTGVGFGQVVDPGPGGVGGGTQQGSLSISASHPNSVLMGTTVVLTGIAVNGNGSNPLWERKACGGDVWETKPNWSTWTIGVCADCEGETTYRLNATVNGVNISFKCNRQWCKHIV